jgi:hypothetical protein
MIKGHFLKYNAQMARKYGIESKNNSITNAALPKYINTKPNVSNVAETVSSSILFVRLHISIKHSIPIKNLI